MENSVNHRSDWVDYAKGIGIILVVYGHLLSSAYHAGIHIPQHFFALSDSVVYSFHMPLFFLLSGLFVEGSLQKRGARQYFVEKLTRIAYPYFLWSLLQVSVEVLFSGQTQQGATIKDIYAIPYQPWGQFWFLYALFLMDMLYLVFSRFGRFSLVLIILAGLGFFFYPFGTGLFALFGFSTHFIFFVLGIALQKYLSGLEKLNPSSLMGLFLMAGFIVSAYFIFTRVIEPTRLAGDPHKGYFLFLATLGMAASTVLSMYLARTGKLPFLKILGLYSLPIFLVHMLAGVGTRVILLNIFHIENWIIHMAVGVLMALVTPIILQIISQRIQFPYLFEIKPRRVPSAAE